MRQINIWILSAVLLAGCGQADKGANITPEKIEGSMATVAQEPGSMSTNIVAGMQSLNRGDVRTAIKDFSEAIRENPQDLKGYMMLGQTYMHLKAYNRAAGVFAVATRVQPQNGSAHYLLATNLGLLGNYKTAELEAKKSLEIFRENKDLKNFQRSIALMRDLNNSQSKSHIDQKN